MENHQRPGKHLPAQTDVLSGAAPQLVPLFLSFKKRQMFLPGGFVQLRAGSLKFCKLLLQLTQAQLVFYTSGFSATVQNLTANNKNKQNFK